MQLQIDVHLHYRLHAPCDLLIAVEAAELPDQRLLEDRLTVSDTGPLVHVAGEDGVGRRSWAWGFDEVEVRYSSRVAVERAGVDLGALAADPLSGLPAGVNGYLWPSRYCDSDRFEPYVRRRFGALEGGAKVQAIADWVRAEMRYVPGASDASTMAGHSFTRREGVCRDYAHLLIAMVRAADIPARMVAVYGLGVDPPDFHAVTEVWLDGGWRLVDATGMADVASLVRIGVGRDATDVSFLTVFGTADLVAQAVRVERVD